MNSTKNKLNLRPLGSGFIPVFIDEETLYKIKYLCKLIAREEWSGVLFYTVKGSIKHPKSFSITIKDVFPMNKGTAGFTSYEFDERLVEYRMDNPETLQMQVGHIHSHNTMNTFFSGTDEEELTDNAGNHNYYLSVIVNNYLDFSIRIAMFAETDAFVAKDENGESYPLATTPVQSVFYYNGKIQLEEETIPVPEKFSHSVKNIIVEKEKRDKEIEKKKKQAFNKGFNGSTQKQLPFHEAFTAAEGEEDKYDEVMDYFIVDLLGQNTPLVMTYNDLNGSLGRLDKFMKPEEINEYIASTISDYPALYSMTFGNNDANSATIFMEDLGVIIQRLEEENELLESELIKKLIEQFGIFAEEFENAEL